MELKLEYKDVPKNYLFCHCNQCPRHKKCLRYQAALCIPDDVPHYSSINPNYQKAKDNSCGYFQSCDTARFARGMDHILDNIPYKVAVSIRKDLLSMMGRSMYYRIRNKERLLHPVEQEQVFAVFTKHGIKTKPEFDEYIDMLDW